MARALEQLETYTFSADIAQLMGVIVNTVYSNKEIFLRELISNASDALERACHRGSEGNCAHVASSPQEELHIRVIPDKENLTLTVEDTGIGMTREELIESLGMIARSKTKAFMEAAAAAAGMEPALIGQFGIGFYSAYVVSERVRVVSKSDASEAQYIWESTAGGAFTVAKDESFEHGVLTRGTKVICFLREDQLEFLNCALCRELMMRHSCFVKWPLLLYAEHLREEPLDPGVQGGTTPCAERHLVVTHVWELMNAIRPVWLQPAEEVSESEYARVYRWLTGDFAEPLARRHLERSSDRQVDFRALLFCSRTAPEDIFDLIDGRTQGAKIRLYVRRVFVKEFSDLLPKWMCFVKGIVDSDDLPLNISREQLQKESAVMRHISRVLVRECLEMLRGLERDEVAFRAFHDAFGQNLKLGMHEDTENQSEIVSLLRYHTTQSGDGLVSLREYVARMKPGQQHILYVTGRSRRHALQSPLIEGFKRDGYEVILMSDPADEFAMQVLKEFEGRELVSATSAQASAVSVCGCMATAPGLRPEELWALQCRVEQALLAGERECKAVFKEQGVTGPLPAAIGGEELDQPLLILNSSHGLFQELARRGDFSSTEVDLVLLLHDLAVAFAADRGSEGSEVRRRLGERLQEMVRRLDGGDRDADEEDLPCLAEDWLAPEVAGPWGPSSCSRSPAAEAHGSWSSVGSPVRVVGNERSRRGMVAFADEAAGTVDVLYASSGAREADAEEEEGLPTSSVLPLMDFEVDPDGTKAAELRRDFGTDFVATAARVKEEGNLLFKLKDFEAAAERYTVVVEAVRSRPLDLGQVVLKVAGAGPGVGTVGPPGLRLQRAVVQRAQMAEGAEGECELDDGGRCGVASLLPVLGLSTLKPMLEQVRVFRCISEPVLEQISAAAAVPALEQVSLQAAVYMNRARCRAALELHQQAAQDLTVALGLWVCLEASQEPVGEDTRAAITRGLCTAAYLRAKARLSRGLAKAAAADVRWALERGPPTTTRRQLEHLQTVAWAAAGERHRVREPLARELAKVTFALRSTSL